MKTYKVTIPEIHYATYTVEAANAADAKAKVLDGLEGPDSVEYSHIDPDVKKYKAQEIK